MWDDAALVATDEFWAMVNPGGAELLVEIMPPVHLRMLPRPAFAAGPPAGPDLSAPADLQLAPANATGTAAHDAALVGATPTDPVVDAGAATGGHELHVPTAPGAGPDGEAGVVEAADAVRTSEEEWRLLADRLRIEWMEWVRRLAASQLNRRWGVTLTDRRAAWRRWWRWGWRGDDRAPARLRIGWCSHGG